MLPDKARFRLLENAVAISAEVHLSDQFKTLYDCCAEGGYPDIYQLCVEAAEAFTAAEGDRDWTDADWTDAVEHFVGRLIRDSIESGRCLARDELNTLAAEFAAPVEKCACGGGGPLLNGECADCHKNAAQKAEGAEPEPPAFDPATALKLVADTPAQLRACDVDRLAETYAAIIQKLDAALEAAGADPANDSTNPPAATVPPSDLAFLIELAEIRLVQWRAAAKGRETLDDALSEFDEADAAECNRMADLIDQMLRRVRSPEPEDSNPPVAADPVMGFAKDVKAALEGIADPGARSLAMSAFWHAHQQFYTARQ